jgi:DNA-directed RNA polymerase subunit RPC12/RpoP
MDYREHQPRSAPTAGARRSLSHAPFPPAPDETRQFRREVSMPISFSCGGCGKAFTTRDELGGKKVSCKTCGHRMRVPTSTVKGEKPHDAAAPADKSPGGLYDLAETQPDPPSAGPEQIVDIDVSEGKSKRRKTRRHRVSSDGEGSWRGHAPALPVGAIAVAVLVLFCVSFDFGGHTRARKFHEQALKLENELYECVRRCRDEASAEKNAPRMNDILDRIDKLLADYQAHRAGERDIWAVEAEFKNRHQSIEQRLSNEINNKEILRVRDGGIVSEGNLLKIDLRRFGRVYELKSPNR